MSIETRIQKLESSMTPPESQKIHWIAIHSVWPKDQTPLPLIGWELSHTDEKVFRLPGEDNEMLLNRAQAEFDAAVRGDGQEMPIGLLHGIYGGNDADVMAGIIDKIEHTDTKKKIDIEEFREIIRGIYGACP